ncbi:hypothetical protein JL101_035455 (plasmid) [Skermanella rosea]|uniref:hypothetical protein n=1 Tax=Skermanella rosea TaxID=1817965 RepID=UPI00193210E7|nr:hypothetical protein [Skermanella rosea]UEM08096.1 hypothetical protein JL101_035455 [Skermanella rosea]
MSANNLDLWNSVAKTDPAHTKYVNQRGGFTSIDSYYQIQRATEQFGPLGLGWGYDADYVFHEDLIACTLRLWYVLEGKRSEAFPVTAMNPWRELDKSGKVRLDDDAAKKALTDAITKALSYLGFSADVFMGLYDDNKYVAGLKREFAEAGQKPKAAAKEAATKSTGFTRAQWEGWVKKYTDGLAECMLRGDLMALLNDASKREGLAKLKAAHLDLYDAVVREQMRSASMMELTPEEFKPDPEAMRRILAADKEAVSGMGGVA